MPASSLSASSGDDTTVIELPHLNTKNRRNCILPKAPITADILFSLSEQQRILPFIRNPLLRRLYQASINKPLEGTASNAHRKKHLFFTPKDLKPSKLRLDQLPPDILFHIFCTIMTDIKTMLNLTKTSRGMLLAVMKNLSSNTDLAPEFRTPH